MKKSGSIFGSILCILCAVLLIAKGNIVAQGAAQGINLCLQTVIPALFCFMVLTNFFIQSGLYRLLSIPLRPITKTLFYLPAEVGSIILLSLVGGYPTGAIAVSNLLAQKQLNLQEAQRMLCYCCCAGPSFIITAVGSGMFGNIRLGTALFLSELVSSLLIALFCGLSSRFTSQKHLILNSVSLSLPAKATSLSQAFVNSVGQAVSACGKMCGFIILFQAFSAVVTPFFSDARLACLLLGPMEVTNGCRLASSLPFGILYACFFLSFGGFCVLAQICGILQGSGICMTKFFAARIVHGLLSSAILFFYLRFSHQSMDVFSSVCRPVPICDNATPLLSICLVMMSILLFSHIRLLVKQK